MKILSFVARVATMLLAVILFSCGENPTALKGPSEEQVFDTQGKKGGPKIAADIVVSPSGDASGVTDANSIEAAMASLPAGGTLLLESGQFYANRAIVAPIGFHGVIRGISQDKTIISPVGDDGSPFQDDQFLLSGNPLFTIGTTLFHFLDPSTEMTMSDLSITVPEGFATAELFDPSLTVLISVRFESSEANTNFSNLKLSGATVHPGNPFWLKFQPLWGIMVSGDDSSLPALTTGGKHTITDSEISKVGVQSTAHQILSGANILIKNNTYFDIKQSIYRVLEGCALEVAFNKIVAESWGTVVLTQEGNFISGENNSAHVHHNNVSTAGFMPIEVGFILPGSAGYDLLIEKNKLVNFGPDPNPAFPFPNLAGIGILGGTSNAIVRNNKIDGAAEFAILLDANGSLLQGNNTNGLDLLVDDLGDPLGAHYGLFGDNNTVVGTGNSTAIDGGTGNIITGAQKVEGTSVGDRIKAAQEKRKEILNSLHD